MKLTIKEYAKLRGIGPSAVRKAIKLGHKLPGVRSRYKVGPIHILEVDTTKVKKFQD